MTSEEIVKALRTCVMDPDDGGDCGNCPASRSEGEYCLTAVMSEAASLIERLTAENAALREKQRWILVTERPPEERVLVNVVWVNRAPEPYYERIKNVPFSGTACFYRGNWYWDSPVVLDLLAEYGEDAFDLVDEAVEITHWRPLPEAPEEGEKA